MTEKSKATVLAEQAGLLIQGATDLTTLLVMLAVYCRDISTEEASEIASSIGTACKNVVTAIDLIAELSSAFRDGVDPNEVGFNLAQEAIAKHPRDISAVIAFLESKLK